MSGGVFNEWCEDQVIVAHRSVSFLKQVNPTIADTVYKVIHLIRIVLLTASRLYITIYIPLC